MLHFSVPLSRKTISASHQDTVVSTSIVDSHAVAAVNLAALVAVVLTWSFLPGEAVPIQTLVPSLSIGSTLLTSSFHFVWVRVSQSTAMSPVHACTHIYMVQMLTRAITRFLIIFFILLSYYVFYAV
jgi:hypothetical protein